MNEGDPHLRKAAAAVLADRLEEPTYSRLVEWLNSPDLELRAAAAQELGASGNLDAIKPLIEMASQDSPAREHASAALERLGVKPFTAEVAFHEESPALVTDHRYQLTGTVRVGTGHAVNLKLALSGPLVGDVPVITDICDLAEPNQSLPWTAGIKPGEAGDVSLYYELTFADLMGNRSVPSGIRFLVSEPRPADNITTNIYHGSVQQIGNQEIDNSRDKLIGRYYREPRNR
jgi:hypothetical protein